MNAPASRPLRVTPTMLAVIRQAAKGLPLTGHLHGRSEFGGFQGTLLALYRRGLLNHQTGELTEAGKRLAQQDLIRNAVADAKADPRPRMRRP